MINGAEISLIAWQLDAASEPDGEVFLSFEEAFETHHQLVFRYAAALTRDKGLAEDVVQEVFVRLYQHLNMAQKEGLLRAWLLRVTANVAHNARRRRRRAQSLDEAFAAHRERVTVADLPDEALERQCVIIEAQRALAKLKEPMRSCLLLKHEGLSYKEIAVALDINESNVGSLLARGRREFMRVYGKIGRS